MEMLNKIALYMKWYLNDLINDDILDLISEVELLCESFPFWLYCKTSIIKSTMPELSEQIEIANRIDSICFNTK